MIRARHTFTVGRPVAEVFAFVADPENEPRWNRACLAARIEDGGPPRQGTRFHMTLRFMGRTFESRLAIEVHEPPRRLVNRTLESPFPMRAAYRFEPAGDAATRVEVEVEAELQEFLGVIPERLMAPLFEKSLADDAERQKAAIEDESSFTIEPRPGGLPAGPAAMETS